MARTIYAHWITCDCATCTPRFIRSWRMDLILRCLTRTLLLLAVLIAIPFMMARAIASMKETR